MSQINVFDEWSQIGQRLQNFDERVLVDWVYYFNNDYQQKVLAQMAPPISTAKPIMIKPVAESINYHNITLDFINYCDNNIVCTSVKDNQYYIFDDNHKWTQVDINWEIDQYFRDKYQCNYSFSNSIDRSIILKELSTLTYDDSFLAKLNENTKLICFNDGIFDLSTGYFRDGKPNDYISLSTNCDFITYYKTSDTYKAIKQFFRNIQPDKTMRQYLKLVLGSCIAGRNGTENVYILSGPGSTGKTSLMQLLKSALGDLFSRVNSNLDPGSILQDKKGIRVCVLDDCTTESEYSRLIYILSKCQNGISFDDPLQYKPFIITNILPLIEYDDHGLWRRIKVIPFSTKITNPDPFLTDKFPVWKNTFIAMLIKYYKKYQKTGLITPQLVVDCTKTYRKQCNIIQAFLDDKLVDCTDNTMTITLMHEKMNNWIEINYPTVNCPSIDDLRIHIYETIKTYDPETDKLVGYALYK